jgi:hypothetical protein
VGLAPDNPLVNFDIYVSRLLRTWSIADERFGKSNWIQLPTGIKMHYVENGKGNGDKPLMVFLHGFPEFWFSWRFQLAHFSKDFW